jgi:hypothetical protein
MFYSLLSRPTVARLAMLLVMCAQVLGWVTSARGGETAPLPPVPASLLVKRRALREFDRFLDHHPLVEEQLRRNPRLLVDGNFLNRNPELHGFIQAVPLVFAALEIYPRYYLNRALLREASAPLTFADLAPFKLLFQAEPPLERELALSPELIRDPAFLARHPALQGLFAQHPDLARVFLPVCPCPNPN